eukprot:6174782-Pleurochrysis_carterae.AAC.1
MSTICSAGRVDVIQISRLTILGYPPSRNAPKGSQSSREMLHRGVKKLKPLLRGGYAVSRLATGASRGWRRAGEEAMSPSFELNSETMRSARVQNSFQLSKHRK